MFDKLLIRSFSKDDWTTVSKIYADGLTTGMATFETEVPLWEDWNKKFHKDCRLVAVENSIVLGFAMLSPVSTRDVYKGVAEVTIYIAKSEQGKGIGKLLLKALVEQSEAKGYWTLQAGIFSENTASIKLHEKCGFRMVGIREKIGQLHGKWYDNVLMERRRKLNMNN